MPFKPLKPQVQNAPVRFKPIGAKTVQKSVGFKPLGSVSAAPGLTFSQPQAKPVQQTSMWRKIGNQLVKPVASASNLLEDTGKGIAAAGIAALTPATFGEVAQKVGFKPLQNQRDVWTGKSQRTFSTMMNEIAKQEENPVKRLMQRTLGYGGDFILDPLNKVKILEATKKGREAMKTGEMALSAADQAAQGQRALLQFGNTNILPSIGNRVLAASTAANDAIRGTKYGGAAIDALSKVSTSIRPTGVSRGEFKAIQDTTRAFKKASEYASQKAIEGAAEVEKLLRKSGADDATRSALLHAVEKGDKSLVPQGLEEVFNKASAIKLANEKLWKEAGGATLENYGLPHVATDAVKEAQPTTNLRGGGKIYSPSTPQDIHRQWVKVNGEVKNLAQEGIKYKKGKKVIDPLLQEARKYKSAEEFVKAQQGIKIYRGGGFDKEKMTDLGTSFSFDRNVANKFPLDTPNRLPAEEFTIDKNAMVLSWKDIPEEIKKYRPPKPENWPSGKVYSPAVARERNIVKFAKDNGYDAVDLSELHAGSEKEIRVLNADIVGNPNITTPFTSDGNKLQLTDLWKKANQAAPEQTLLNEARKYKSAEEFVKAQGESVYRAGEPFDRSKFTDFGMSVGRKKSTAEIFGGKTRGVEELNISKNAKILKDLPPSIKVDEKFDENIVKYARENGYDVVDISNHGVDELRVINPDVIKTKSQLTDLWKKAHRESGGFFDKAGKPVNVEQATAKEINEALVKAGKEGVFKEDLPTSLAVGGISSGRKAAGETFLRNTKNIKSDVGRQIIDETYQRLTNNEAVHKALRAYDKVLGVWKAQVLVAPSYHVRNEVGNIWNNYLANVTPVDMASAAKIQAQMATGKMDDVTRALVTEMEQQGVTGGAQYGKDITQTIADEIGGKSWNPLSQRFGLYRANRAIGTGFEDNARIAHYLAKRRDGYSAVEAAKSVDKFLFDYGNLTFIEQNVLKRVLPFYTWASKNIPLQLSEFVKNPGKFSKAATLQKDIEEPISQPNERYMSEYVKNNSPMRIRTNEDGTTEYLLLGQWIPAAQAIQFLSQPQDEILRGITPIVTIPSDLLNNRSFFKDTLGGEQPIERIPGELGSFLGFDMRKKLINVLRGIRVLNEIDKLNPGEIFGGKGKPSIFQGLTDNASETRGLQHSPDSTQSARTLGFLLGKTSTYDPESAKTYYDRDTQDRIAEYTSQMNNALRLGQTDLAAKILKEMEQFNLDREGKSNKNIEGYNLMGDRYFEDLARNRQAEYNRTDIRTKMKDMIRQAVDSNDSNLLQEALKLDPTYASQAIKDAMKEKSQRGLSEDAKRQLYEMEQQKTMGRLKNFYTK